MASKTQKSATSANKTSPRGKAQSKSRVPTMNPETEMLPSDRNEKTDISAKIAFLAYN